MQQLTTACGAAVPTGTRHQAHTHLKTRTFREEGASWL